MFLSACQEMLQAKQFTCSGWIRRKTALQQVGAKIENTLKVNRAMSVASRIPCKLAYCSILTTLEGTCFASCLSVYVQDKRYVKAEINEMLCPRGSEPFAFVDPRN